jgi:hypothetical protein
MLLALILILILTAGLRFPSYRTSELMVVSVTVSS